jgi:hypothetical protein
VSTDGLIGDGGRPDSSAPDASGALDGGPSQDGPVADPDLVAAWSFDEDSGSSALDVSGHGHHATLVGGARFVPNGIRGGAAELSGGEQQIAVADLEGASFPRNGTLSIWFRYTFEENDVEERCILDCWDQTRNHLIVRRANEFEGNVQPPREFQVAFQPRLPTYAFATAFEIVRNAWAHVVLTWDSDARRATVFVNRTNVASRDYDRPFTPSDQELRLGSNFVGQIDECLLFRRALSTQEVNALP